jgi:DNA modification methylase/DNA-directed RNA polymerase subunit RPC12/RpoP
MSQSNLNLASEPAGPVACLGHKFPSHDARRDHYLKLLAQKLKDPEFRKIEGFPIGKDEDILALSDPPYYTACPNPWLDQFIKYHGTAYEPKKPYHREPFAADVSEGKNHPVYNAHAYHTKVPHRAIMRYILHYTQPGDIVLDGFCGTGMTGVAAQLCGDRAEVQELGYRVQADGTILNEEGKPFSKLGARCAVLNDLAPAATYVASAYCDLTRLLAEKETVLKAIDAVEAKLGNLYELDGLKVLNGIWSDVFICPNCSNEIIYWEAAVKNDEISKAFACKFCNARIGKAASKEDGAVKLDRAFVAAFDPILDRIVQQPKFVLVEETVKTSPGTSRIKATKKRDEWLKKQSEPHFAAVPLFEFEEGRQTNKLINGSFIRYLHQMYAPRALAAYATLWGLDLGSSGATALLRFCLSAINNYISRKQGYFGGGGGVAGTLFTPSIHLERNVFDVLRRKLNKLPYTAYKRSSLISCQSTAAMCAGHGGDIDYIFIDPPFGENFQYAELNSFVEAWLGAKTATPQDCVLNYVHKKDLDFYSRIMHRAFAHCHKALKPGRWLTVEFSNTQAAVWNAIQTGLQAAGFVVANVSSLDKQQLQFNAINNSVSVKQDLIISAYKPNGGLEERFAKRGETEEGVWDFIHTHLRNLPVVKAQGGQLAFIAERDPRILYDRMVAFYVGHSTPVPLSSAEFQAGLADKLPERDGMYFLPEQVNDYDKKRAQIENIGQLTIFVEDERSAINWLRHFLKDRPSTYQDIQPDFMQQLGASWKKWEARPELSALLDQNFLCYDGTGNVPSQIHSYLSTQFKELRNLTKDHAHLKAKAKERWYVPDPKKNVDVETLRNKRLLEEFWSYLPEGYSPPGLTANKGQTLPGLTVPRPKIPKGKKLKELRTEAVRVGFKHCYQQKDYTTILVVAEMLPESVLNEDEQLQMIYDTAVTRTGGGE